MTLQPLPFWISLYEENLVSFFISAPIYICIDEWGLRTIKAESELNKLGNRRKIDVAEKKEI
jgi:hypothetical protein